MKKVISFLPLIFLVFDLSAQTANLATNTSNQKILKVETAKVATDNDVLSFKETEHDFGKIPQGKPVTYIFDVKNNSKDSLKIINVQASCGCTTPDWERNKTQAPGEKTQITVGYNAANEGPFTKVITITYNGTQSKQITIKGEVWKTPSTSAPENKAAENLKDL